MFRLRIGNSKTDEIQAIGHFRPSKPLNNTQSLIRRNSAYPSSRPQINNNIKSPMIKLRATNQIVAHRLPFVLSPKESSSRSNSSFSEIKSKTTSRSSNYNPKKETPKKDCNCILCMNKSIDNRKIKSAISSFKTNDSWSVDAKNFLKTLDQLKTTIKIQRDFDLNQSLLNDTHETSRTITFKIENLSDKDRSRLLHKSSRIKLWRPDEINLLAQMNLKRDITETEFDSRNIGKIFLDEQLNIPINPPTSPLSTYKIPTSYLDDDTSSLV